MSGTGDNVTVAVPRGALMKGSLDLLERAGYDVQEVRENDRKLYFEDQGLITMRPSDVVTYVERGVADIGIVGKDVLMEQSDRDVYELVDLDFGGCSMIVAVPEAQASTSDAASRRRGTLRIATKYPRLTERYFASTGRQAELIEVKGSVELAAIAGLADAIVDLTATGATLKENGLVISEQIADCTARLIANPGAYRLKSAAIDDVAAQLRAITAARGD
ncbi:MAG: ATP phosphoribosyltransferase [Actinobacteria bacterium]|nr:ATP phosphoribosyltransferase [Actinomycetota bacterium]